MRVVVIGCSLGGLLALSDILGSMPHNYPHPIVVVQHRQKHEKSALEEVLQSKLKLKVKQADEKEKVKSTYVYLAPPDYHLLMEEDGSLSLSSDAPVNFSRPSIDVFFETAAEAYKERLVGVLLTGANSDGTKGMLKIKKLGGITIAQHPNDAFCKYMPEAAIKGGAVNHVFYNHEIKKFLLSL